MTIHILHECIDSSDFYAEGNIITINKDKEKLSEKMFLLYNLERMRKQKVQVM